MGERKTPPRIYSPVDGADARRRIDPTPPEFRDWIPVPDATAFIDGIWTHELAARIAKRLRDGSLLAGAGECRRVTDDGIQVDLWITIEPAVWWRVEDLDRGGHSVWEHGEFTSRARPNHGIGWEEANYYDVRFEWSRLFRGFPELQRHFTRSVRSLAGASLLKGDLRPAIPAPTAPSQSRSRLGLTKDRPQPTDSAVLRWLEKYEAKFPDQPHNRLTVAFNNAHPNFSVGKRQLYRLMKKLRGTLSIGNPAISRPKAGR